MVRTALGELPAEQRDVVELAYFGGFSYPEVAARLAIPLGTVKSRMRLALGAYARSSGRSWRREAGCTGSNATRARRRRHMIVQGRAPARRRG
ncbi:MAG: sigma factor-like helix-turn-helix DNA-binding protein [Dehalococcoidia bacterium]